LETTSQGLRTPWETVYGWFGRWRVDGTFERLNATLRERAPAVAEPLGQEPLPSAGVVADSQASKSFGVGGKQRGYDGNKKVRGSKRHLLVDTEGLVLKALPYTARKKCQIRPGSEAPTGVGTEWTLAPFSPKARGGIGGEG